MTRLVVHCSCGAASAVAGKLTLANAAGREVAIVNAYLEEEDKDNRRFLADVERWYGHPVTVLRDEKYGASTDEVWRRERYMKGPRGASCTRALKARILDDFRRPGDVDVIGYTAEEQDRFDDFRERHPGIEVRAPLIEAGLGKADCLAMIERAGIELPLMYRLGFSNANCVGCIRGGKGYWNKIRVHFPKRFAAVAAIEQDIGPSAFLFYDENTKTRFSLNELPPDAGRDQDEPDISCSFFCSIAEASYAAS
jgi:hypothetical protein